MVINTHRRQRGLSLVEVFVALLILSVGLIALAKLQVDLVRGGSDSRARAAALAIAEAKLEDLRTFSLKQAPTGVTWPVADDEPVAWSMIADDAGGRIAGGPLTQAGVQYNLLWTATTQSTDGPVAGGSNKSFFKDVAVNVSWTGPDDVIPQTVRLEASIPDTPPSLTALASMPIVGGEGPQLFYTPGQAPEVIAVPIDLGTGKRETSKPLPDVRGQGDYTHEVRFDVVNYHQVGNDQLVDRREEFVTVNCRCTLASGTGTASRTPAQSVLTGAILRDKPGAVRTDKQYTGTVRTSGSNAVSQQSTLCTICCRDHHDGPDSTSEHRYTDPDSPHAHYLWNGSTYVAASVGDAYDEACRMKRINGIFQVFHDWNLVAVNAIPQSDLSSDSSTYASYVGDVVRSYITNASLPTPPTFSDVNLTPGGSQQLQGRAIYIDRMSAEEKAAAAALITGDDDISVLKSVPWYEINLTKLARWKLQDANTDTDYSTVSGNACRTASQTALVGKVACVSSEPVQTEEFQQDNYNRGLAKGGPVGGTKDARVYLANGNTGLIDTQPLTSAANSAAPIYDEIPIINAAGSAVEGTIQKTDNNNPNGNIWGNVNCQYTVNGGSPTSCGTLNGSGNNNPPTFSFNVTDGATVVVTVTLSGGVVCPASQTVTAPASGLVFTLKSSGSCS